MGFALLQHVELRAQVEDDILGRVFPLLRGAAAEPAPNSRHVRILFEDGSNTRCRDVGAGGSRDERRREFGVARASEGHLISWADDASPRFWRGRNLTDARQLRSKAGRVVGTETLPTGMRCSLKWGYRRRKPRRRADECSRRLSRRWSKAALSSG